MSITNKPAPFWNVEHNFYNLYQAVCHDAAEKHEEGRRPLESDKLTDEEKLYKYLAPNMWVNGNRNVNYIPFHQVQIIFSSVGLRSEILGRIRSVFDYTHPLFHAHQYILTNEYIPLFHESLGAGRMQLESGKIKEAREKIQEFYRITQPFLSEVLARHY